MPHDKRGTELKVGDTVMVPCVIKAIHLTEDYCNVDLQTKLAMPPLDSVQSFTLNSRQTIKPTATHNFPATVRPERSQMNLPDIEVVSAAVHDAWMATKQRQGVTSRKSESGEELIVPYAQLSDAAKELDRGTVRAVYDAIEASAAVRVEE